MWKRYLFQLLIKKSNTAGTDTLIRVLQTFYHLTYICITLPKEQYIQISNKTIIPTGILTDACNISIIIGTCLKHVHGQKGGTQKLQAYSPSLTSYVNMTILSKQIKYEHPVPARIWKRQLHPIQLY